MNKLLVSALIASTSLAIVTTKKATDAEYDRAQIKEDVRLLMTTSTSTETSTHTQVQTTLNAFTNGRTILKTKNNDRRNKN